MAESHDRPSAAATGPAGPGTGSPARVRFGVFTLDCQARKLERGGVHLALPPRAVDALVYLVARRGRVVDKDEIVGAVWRDVAVTDDSLIHAISVLRRALGDDPARPIFIETIPRRGYRFIGAVEAVEMPVAPVSGVSDAPAPAATPTRRARGVTWPSRQALAATAVLLAVAAAGLVYQLGGRTRAPDTDAVRLEQAAPPGTTIISGGAVSPSGRHLAFVARDDRSGSTALWVRAVDSPDSSDARRLHGTDGASHPFFSPDGRMLAFFIRDRILTTDLEGSVIRPITAVPGAPAGGSWGRDGMIVFADWTTGLYAVPAAGGSVTRLTRVDHAALDVAHAWPQFLPDGRRFLYQVISNDSSRTGIYAGSLDAPPSGLPLVRTAAAAYAPPGFLLYLQHDMLLAQPFDTTHLRLGQPAVLVARGVLPPALADGHVASGSPDLLAFREGSTRQQLTWVDRSGSPLRTLEMPTTVFNFRVSPDGRSLLGASSLTTATGLWLLDLQTRASTRLDADGIAPLWSPDGGHVAYTSRAGLDLYLRRNVGETSAELLVRGDTVKVLNDWSPDRQHIVFTQHDPRTKLDLLVLRVSTGEVRPLLSSAFNEAHARISPDGRWIAYMSDESGTPEVYVRRYPSMNAPVRVSTGGGIQPQWRPDQRELFYLAPDRSLMAVSLHGRDPSSSGTPHRLFTMAVGSGLSTARESYTVMADGRSFLVDVRPADGRPSLITLMRNWTTSLAGVRTDIASSRRSMRLLASR